MNLDDLPLAPKIDRLRRTLPVTGFPRPTLPAELRLRKAAGRLTPQLKVIDIIDTGDGMGPLCRFLVDDRDACSSVSQLSQISLDRSHPLTRVVAAHQRQPRPRPA